MSISSDSLIGSWYIQSANAVFTFMSNGTYFFAQGTGEIGMEKGNYSWNSATGALTVTTLADTAGSGFLTPLQLGTTATWSLLLNGDAATLSSSTEGSASLARVASSDNMLIGSWYMQSADAVFTFRLNGTYFFAQATGEIGEIGMEKGNYSWNSVTGALTVTTMVDTAGSGFSSTLQVGATTTWGLLVNGDAATLSSSTEGNFPLLTRVASGNEVLTGNGGTAPLNIAAGIVTLVDVVPGTDIINISSGATAVQSLTVATASYAANTTNNGTLVINALPTTASSITGSSGNDIITGSSADDILASSVGNDILNGSAGNDVMEGGAGNDTYYVDSSNDSVVEVGSVSGSTTLGFRLALDLSSNIDKVIASISYTLGNSLENLDLAAGSGNINGAGNALDNVLAGNEGNNYLDGGAGTDTAVYPAAHASYTIAKTSTGYTVAGGTDGSDTLTNIERLSFTGKRIAIDLDGNAGMAAKLLGAVFGATSVDNPAYVGICLSIVDGGISYSDLMAAALNFAGATTSNAVVTLLWTNLVGTAPTAAQVAPIAALIDNGSYSAAALGVLVADSSFNATNIDLVGLTQMGIEFVY